MKIIKRNGEEAIFDINKIIVAITKANNEVPIAERLSTEQINNIAENISKLCEESKVEMNVEAIQDLVEKGIMKEGA